MTQQEMEARLNALEQELSRMQARKLAKADYHKMAVELCNKHFLKAKQDGQMYTAKLYCEKAAREAFKTKHKVDGVCGKSPVNYIRSAEDAEEYFALFKVFLDVWQSYVYGEDWKKKEDI